MILEKRDGITEKERKKLAFEGAIVIETEDPGLDVNSTDQPDRKVILVRKQKRQG